MKKHSLSLFLAFGFIFFLVVSCTKINESSTVGGDLIPAVDNITTFDTTLKVVATKYFILNDTTHFFFNDFTAIGKMNDPVFGTTTANAYFNVSRPEYGVNPFGDQVTTKISTVDSVILSLSYAGGYGDTSSIASTQTLSVFEISQAAGFSSDSVYKFTQPDFATAGQLGSITFSAKKLADSITIVNGVGDTTRTAYVLRIPLAKSLATRFAAYDTTRGANGGFNNDSIFHTLFKGLAIKAQSFAGGSGYMTYFNLTDQTNSNLTVYYHAIVNGVVDTTLRTVTFYHSVNGQANCITRQNGGDYAAYASVGASPAGSLFIQSTPGSYVAISIPALDAFKATNKVIHRAELIINKVNSSNPASDVIFTPPPRLFLDQLNTSNTKAFMLQNDIGTDPTTGSVDLTPFGGDLRSDNTYHFTLTRHVQGIVTRGENNWPLRLHAPLHPIDYSSDSSSVISVSVINRPANGRVVVAGSNYIADPTKNMRLRIIYSKL